MWISSWTISEFPESGRDKVPGKHWENMAEEMAGPGLHPPREQLSLPHPPPGAGILWSGGHTRSPPLGSVLYCEGQALTVLQTAPSCDFP